MDKKELIKQIENIMRDVEFEITAKHQVEATNKDKAEAIVERLGVSEEKVKEIIKEKHILTQGTMDTDIFVVVALNELAKALSQSNIIEIK